MADISSRIPPEASKVFEGVIFDIYQWQQKMFDGSFATFEMARRDTAVGIIPIVDDKVVAIHEEQPGRVKNVGFPGGHVENDEDPLTAAKRELLEETGMTFKTWKLVLVEDIGSHKIEWWCYRFIAKDLIKQAKPAPNSDEKIELELMDFETAKKHAKDNIYMAHHVMEKVDSLKALLNLPDLSRGDELK